MIFKLFHSLYRRLPSFILSTALVLSGIHCTPKKIASDITSQIMMGGAPAFEMEPDIEIAQQTGITLIKMIEGMQYDNQSNKTYKLILSRSYANYAFGFYEWDILSNPAKAAQSMERAKRFYEAGKRYGLEILTKKGSFKNALNKDLKSFEKSLRSFGKKDVPALFWTAFNWGSLINLSKDSPAAIADFPKVEAVMRRAYDLDENYFYGGPNLFFGVSYASRPAMFGGNTAKAKEHFEKALQAYNRNFLLGLVMYAQFYAVQTQDRDLFNSLLNEVAGANASALPEQRLANELAKQRAQWLLANETQFFQ